MPASARFNGTLYTRPVLETALKIYPTRWVTGADLAFFGHRPVTVRLGRHAWLAKVCSNVEVTNKPWIGGPALRFFVACPEE